MKYLKNGKNTSYCFSDIYDIVIVGGGLVGLTFVSALGAKLNDFPLKIALIEESDFKNVKKWIPSSIEYSNRVSSLNTSTVSFLQDIGVWKYVKKDRIQPYHEMQIWDALSSSRIHFYSKNYKKKYITSNVLAFMIENINLQFALLKKINELSNSIYTFDSTKIASITYNHHPNSNYDLSRWPCIKLLNGKTLVSRLLIGADGAHSLVRQFSEIKFVGQDYNAHGLVATLKLDQFSSVNGIPTAWQRFLPQGPIALLPLPDKYATLVWSCSPEIATFLKSLPKSTFLSLINAAYRLNPTDLSYILSLKSHLEIEDQIKWRLGLYQEKSPVPSFAIDLQDNTRASFHDAAHTIHPLSGQGLNMGLRDAKSLSEIILDALSFGQDIGNYQVLQQYTSDRYWTNYMMLAITDGLYKLYSTDNPLVVGLRSVGLSSIDRFNWIKRMLIKEMSMKF
ncbi:hypothetical protein PCANB_001507 [Pneumocystis canis]|nr:hypothetical protein PCANB_001507 [Pneumocystis canis]